MKIILYTLIFMFAFTGCATSTSNKLELNLFRVHAQVDTNTLHTHIKELRK